MNVLFRGQTVGASGTPALAFSYGSDRGILTDLYALSFQVFDVSTEAKRQNPVQVYPVTLGAAQPLDVVNADRTGIGRYAAPWTVPINAPVGAYEVRWLWKASSALDPIQMVRQPFDVMPYQMTLPPALYALPSDLRAEGVTEHDASDPRLLMALGLASMYAEKVTGRFFEPRYMQLQLDGNASTTTLLHEPIVAVEGISFASTLLLLADLPANADSYRVYNRHLRGMMKPDDRQNPRIELYGLEDFASIYSLLGLKFPRGQQNVHVTGLFGYTDPDGSPFGATPLLLREACKLLALRHIPKMTDYNGRAESKGTWRVTAERTRDQGLNYGWDANKGSLVGAFTGDPEIDTLLCSFCRPPHLGAA